MRKYIYILNALELMSKLYAGKRLEGVLYIDENTGGLTFKAWNRTAPKYRRRKDELVHQLETGWVKESSEKFKVFISVYKKLGLVRIMDIIDSVIPYTLRKEQAEAVEKDEYTELVSITTTRGELVSRASRSSV